MDGAQQRVAECSFRASALARERPFRVSSTTPVEEGKRLAAIRPRSAVDEIVVVEFRPGEYGDIDLVQTMKQIVAAEDVVGGSRPVDRVRQIVANLDGYQISLPRENSMPLRAYQTQCQAPLPRSD